MTLNFTDALDRRASDIERPKLMPVGTYRWRVSKVPSVETSPDGKWDWVSFNLSCLGAEDDVDPQEVADFGDLSKAFQSHRFIFDKQDQNGFDRSLYGLKRFLLDHLQVEGDDSTPLKQLMAESVNHQCLGTIIWKADKKDAELQHANIGRTAPIGG